MPHCTAGRGATEPTAPRSRYVINRRSFPMSIIKARAEDWRPDRPSIRLGRWIGLFVGVAILYVVAMGLVGHVFNGNGSPFLS